MYQGEECYRHWEATGEFRIPDGVDAVIRSHPKAAPDDGRRSTYVLFPDGSEASLAVYKLLGHDAVRMSWCHDPHENWPKVVSAEDAQVKKQAVVIHGIDKRALGDRYAAVRGTFLRSDADMYVVVNPLMDEADWMWVRSAQQSGHSVLVATMRDHAPASTEWIDRVIP